MFEVNQRVRIHPATDLFMMGETHATVIKVGRKWVTVLTERAKLKVKFPASTDLLIDAQCSF